MSANITPPHSSMTQLIYALFVLQKVQMVQSAARKSAVHDILSQFKTKRSLPNIQLDALDITGPH